MRPHKAVSHLARRAPLWLLLWTVVLVLLGWPLRDLHPALDVGSLTPPDSRAGDPAFRRLQDAFGASGEILLVLESPTPLLPATAAARVGELVTAVQGLPDVAAVRGRLSPALLRYREEVLPRLTLRFLEPDEIRQLADRLSPVSVRAAADRLRTVRSADPLGLLPLLHAVANRGGWQSPLRLADGLLTDSSQRRYFVLVRSAAVGFDLPLELRLVDALEGALNRLRQRWQARPETSGLRIAALGRPQAHAEAYRRWRGDAWRALLTSVPLIYLAFTLWFRRPLAALAALLPIAIAVAGALTLAQWLHGQVHLVTLVFCVLLVGLGIDFTFHLAAHYWLLPKPAAARTPEQQLVWAVATPARAIVLGAATTATAFAALGASRIPAIRATGPVLATGMLALLATAFTLVPALLHLGSRGGAVRPPSRWPRLLERLAASHRTRWRRRLGRAAWTGLALLALPGVAQLSYVRHPQRLLAEGIDAASELQRLTREVGVSFHPLVALSSGASPADALAADRELLQSLGREPRRAGIALVESLAGLVPPATISEEATALLTERAADLDPQRFRRRYREALTAAAVPADPFLWETYPREVARRLELDQAAVDLDRLEQLGLSERLARHLRQIDGRWYVASYLYPRRYPWEESALEPLRRFWESAPASSRGPRVLLGPALESRHHGAALRADAWRVTSLAVAAVGVLLALGLGSVGDAGRALAPVAMTLWLLAGTMGYLGLEVHFMTLAALPVLLGIGVDDGIHLNIRLSRGQALASALREAGPGLVMTSLTTAAAFFSLLPAANRTVREFGLLAGLGVLLCLAATVHLLPLLQPPRSAPSMDGAAAGLREAAPPE